MESSPPRQEGDRARLASPVFDPSPQECQLRFYYHMYGAEIGSLAVYTRTQINGPLTLKWTRIGNFGDFYERGDIILNMDDPFQVTMFILFLVILTYFPLPQSPLYSPPPIFLPFPSCLLLLPSLLSFN